jgi:DNA-directed RNA polymerase sigma subunit (sigma70/sigma32)
MPHDTRTKERNEELRKLRDSDPKHWTYKRLGQKYSISPERARQICTYLRPREA